MSPDLEKSLIEKYPNLFKDYHCDPKTSCMAWGIECDDGWYTIIKAACAAITEVDSTAYFCQIKEKFGTMRMYLQGNAEAQAIASMAESLSELICEKCGTTKNVSTKSPRYWISTLCEDCWKELDK